MKISVLVCTYNRCSSLKDTLVSLQNQIIPKEAGFDYEVVIADNNSNDGTKDVVEYYKPIFNGRLRYIFEPKQGKSFALNTAVKAAHGGILALTDDDVIVSKDWLFSIFNAFKNTNADCVGGRIYPNWNVVLPCWFSEKLYGRLALLDYGSKSFQIKPGDDYDLFGANYAFKKYCFDKFGFFRTDLCRKGNKLFSGEDAVYVKSILKKGAKVVYDPTLIVNHKIEKDRVRKSYFRRWHFYMGISKTFDDSGAHVLVKKSVFDIPRYLIRDFLETTVKYLKFTFSGNKKEQFFNECRLIFYCSYFMTKIKLKIKS